MIGVDSDDSLNPFFEFWHFLAWELIPAAGDLHAAILIEQKLSIFESPAVALEPLLLISDGLAALNLLLFKYKLKLMESVHKLYPQIQYNW